MARAVPRDPQRPDTWSRLTVSRGNPLIHVTPRVSADPDNISHAELIVSNGEHACFSPYFI